jgi:hypothetical protein
MASKVTTLFEDSAKQNALYPRTKVSAISDGSNNGLDAILETVVGDFAQIETSPATYSHAVNDYIVYEYQLYKVTSAITAGDNLVVGTNIASTSARNEFTVQTQTVTVTTNVTLTFARFGRIVCVSYHANGTAITSQITGNVPAGFKPAYYVGFVMNGTDNNYVAINTSGVFRCLCADAYGNGCSAYITNDQI